MVSSLLAEGMLAEGMVAEGMVARNLLGWVLISFVATYLLVNLRDVLVDAKFIFDRRLVRRYLLKFSLRTLLVSMTVAAVFYAIVAGLNVPPRDWFQLVLIMGVVIGAAFLLRWAVQDVLAKGVRRQYRETYDTDAGTGSRQIPEIKTNETRSVGPISVKVVPDNEE